MKWVAFRFDALVGERNDLPQHEPPKVWRGREGGT